MGTPAETGYRHFNPDIIEQFNVSRAELDEEVRRQADEINRRIQRYRCGGALPHWPIEPSSS